MSDIVKDIHPEIKIENQEMEIKLEDDLDNNTKPWNSHESLSDDNSFTFVAMKKEYVAEENDDNNVFENEASIDIKDEMVDSTNINEDYYIKDYLKNSKPENGRNGNINIKEETESENVIGDCSESYEEPLIECTFETDVEEDPLVPVKDEPIPDTETSQNGSTSQAYVVGDGNLSRENNEIRSEKISNKAKLAKHTLIPSGKRSHECEVCNKKYAKKCKLKVHMRTHTGERPFECEICKKTFTEKRNLDVHTRVHFGQKPHKCEICNKKYSQKASLDAHMGREHSWC